MGIVVVISVRSTEKHKYPVFKHFFMLIKEDQLKPIEEQLNFECSNNISIVKKNFWWPSIVGSKNTLTECLAVST